MYIRISRRDCHVETARSDFRLGFEKHRRRDRRALPRPQAPGGGVQKLEGAAADTSTLSAEVYEKGPTSGYDEISAPWLQSRGLHGVPAVAREGLRKCKTPLFWSGVCKSTRSGKGGPPMVVLMLVAFLVLLRNRRIKLKFEIEL